MSLSTHTSPLLTAIHRGCSFPAGPGSGKEGSQGAAVMSQQEMNDGIVAEDGEGGETQQVSKQAMGQAK